jgi:hypothetical protein
MDLAKVLNELRDELANLDAAIMSLERLQQEGGARRRGRPPKVLADIRKASRPQHREQAADSPEPEDT